MYKGRYGRTNDEKMMSLYSNSKNILKRIPGKVWINVVLVFLRKQHFREKRSEKCRGRTQTQKTVSTCGEFEGRVNTKSWQVKTVSLGIHVVLIPIIHPPTNTQCDNQAPCIQHCSVSSGLSCIFLMTYNNECDVSARAIIVLLCKSDQGQSLYMFKANSISLPNIFNLFLV